jgi:pimeloyl-ACP methyl ester carboxylesterase
MKTTVHTLDVPDACLYYELRGEGPLLALVGAPMDADAFGPIAELLAASYTMLTTDPRGIHRSRLDAPDSDSTPRLRADDLYRLLTRLGRGPATVFGSSGGAATALALVQEHPETVHTVVAHEPPMDTVLEDHAALDAQTEQIIATYLAGDVLGAWTQFLGQAGIELPDPVVRQLFGGDRDPRRVADERYWFAHELRWTNRWEPDLDTLRATPARLVIGIGDASKGQLCERISLTLAGRLGIEPTPFPGGHTGFADDPAPFAHHLHQVLTNDPTPDWKREA